MKPVITVHIPFLNGGSHRQGRRVIHEREIGEVLSDALMSLSPSRWGGAHVEVFKDNYTEECKIDIASASTIRLEEDDRFIVVVLPSASLAIGSLISSTFSSFVVNAAVGFGLSFLSAALKPSVWVGAGAAARTKASPLNQLDPPRNQPRLGSRIPSIYGKMRTWPDLIFPPYEIWGGPTLKEGRLQTLYSVYGVTEGLASLEELYVGESPLEAVSGAQATILNPGDPIPDEFAHVRSNATFANFPLEMAQDWPDPSVGDVNGWDASDPDAGFTDWIRLPDFKTSKILTQFLLPNGALASEYKYGSSGAYWHDVLIQYREVDPVTGAPIGATLETSWAVSLASTSPHQYTHEVGTPEAMYEVRYRRTDNNIGRDKGGADIDQYHRGVTVVSASSLHILQPSEKVNDTTRVMLKFENFSSSSQVSVNAQSRFSLVAERNLPQVNLAGTGIDPAAPTSRWIDAMYHMLTDPNIGGYPASEIDTDSLIKVQKTMLSRAPSGESPESGEYCAIFDTLMSVDEQIQSCATIARATLFSDGANIIAAVDADNRYDEDGNLLEPYERFTALFNRRNRSDSDLTAGIAMRAALPTEADGVELRWIDRDTNWENRTYVYTPSGSSTALRPIRVEAKGITNWPQAWRHAVYLFKRNLYRRKSTTLNCFEEARLLQVFDSVAVVQPWREVALDGQVIDYDDTVPGFHYITVDQDITNIVPFSDTIRIRSTNGRETEVFDILEVDASISRIRLGPRGDPDPHISIMTGVPDTQVGNLYSISTDANHEKDTWIVLGTNAQSYEGTVTLANADNRVFDGDSLSIPGFPELPFTAPRTPLCSQHPCLSLWYWPEEDQTFEARRTRFQEPFEFDLSTTSGTGHMTPDRGLRMRPVTNNDQLIIDINNEPDGYDWWNPLQSETSGTAEKGIFYFDIDIEEDAVTQPGSRFFWYFRQTNIRYFGLTLQADTGSGHQIQFLVNDDGTLRVYSSNVYVTAAGRYRVAAAYEDITFGVAYVYAGIDDGVSQRGATGSFFMPPIKWPVVDHLLSFTIPQVSAYSGTMYLREHRFYNCIPNEQFVQDLASGLISECPL